MGLQSSSLPQNLASFRLCQLGPAFAMAVILLPTVHHLYHDYQAFMALGPGGTPKTLLGYLRIKVLSFCALKDPYSPSTVLRRLQDHQGFLAQLPRRGGSRPKTEGIAPHRQVTQTASTATFDKLAAAINEIGSAAEDLEIGTSCFEKHGTGLFSVSPARSTCKGEVCHAHPSDRSLHMTLHPADAKIVLEAGWGERHPLARGGWFERFVPYGFVMVYAPRSDTEVETVLQIVKAATWHVKNGRGSQDCESARRDSGYASADDAEIG